MALRELGQLTLETERAASDAAGSSAGISPLTGQQPPPTADVTAAHLRICIGAFAERQRLLADAIGVSEVAGLLGVRRQTPHDRLKAGTLLAAVKSRGRWWFPIWQFDPDGPEGAVAGLPEVLRRCAGISDLGRVRWFVTPRGALQARAPLEVLRVADVDAVVAAAEDLGAS